ncbi:radical SAM/SPASM domain-containing protein [Chondromyces apiculatus]|uniref:Radical SAM domain protein n=1 Tax=Chondromyces apiculatus DSM 436 TaxID=1192034 RepID=A0A017T3I1_9BACT|nr:radical SAM protein [Chondromyces apiculatus]EYF03091.1 radical SAM domain protein [Chondromyces apiculatus DSM 436]
MPKAEKLRLPLFNAGADLAELEPFALPDLTLPPVTRPLSTNEPSATSSEVTPHLRTSSFTIYVDLPGEPSDMLLVHGYTGAYDRVSRRVATYLRSLETHRAPKPLYGQWVSEPRVDGQVVTPSDAVIAILKKRGYLVDMSPEEEDQFFSGIAGRYHQASQRRAPGYVIIPTYQCNLRCHYCFQDHMRTDPAYAHILRAMDRPMADRILQGMLHLEASHGLDPAADITRQVTFFGGEPLLASNHDVVGYLIARLRERGKASFSAVSNATELDAYQDLLGPEGIASIQVTLDGPPAEHDLRRIYPDRSGSFDRIARNIRMALDLGVEVSIRINVDRVNLAKLPELAEVFHAQGWASHPGFLPYVAPIHAANTNVDAKSVFGSWELSRSLEALKQSDPRVSCIGISDNSILARARQIFDGKSATNPSFRASFCGAHSTMYVLDALGDIYACWERTGDTKERIGHIDDLGRPLMNRSMLTQWRGRSVVSNPVCRKCRYAASCGGGCAILAEESNGDAYTNHCDGFGKRFRASVAKAYQEFLRGERSEATVVRSCET